MNLAFTELRRSRSRYAIITIAVGFIVFLALILAALADGLFLSNTGALRNTNADGYLFDADADRSFSRSELSGDTLDDVANANWVNSAGPVAFLELPARSGDTQLSVVVAGFIPGLPGGPTVEGTPTLDLAVADRRLEDREGIVVGDELELGDGVSLTVSDMVDDMSYLGAATVWVPFQRWVEIRDAVRPELSGRDPVQAVAFAAEDPEAAIASINDSVEGVEAVDRDTAVMSLPAVAQQESTFTAIVGATFVVVALVVALFFALVTMEKRTQYAVLKAIGARTGTLAVGVLVQATITAAVGFLLGFGISRLVGAFLPPAVPATFVTGTAVSLLVATVVMGGLGAVLSFRRIGRIDPASALGGAE